MNLYMIIEYFQENIKLCFHLEFIWLVSQKVLMFIDNFCNFYYQINEIFLGFKTFFMPYTILPLDNRITLSYNIMDQCDHFPLIANNYAIRVLTLQFGSYWLHNLLLHSLSHSIKYSTIFLWSIFMVLIGLSCTIILGWLNIKSTLDEFF